MAGGPSFERANVTHPRTETSPRGEGIARAAFAVDRALGDLRRGGAVALADGAGGASAVLSAEYATPEGLAFFAALPGARARLALAARRARALGLAAAGDAAAIALPLPAPLDAERIRLLADPTGPEGASAAAARGARAEAADAREEGAVALVKLAGLLPAALAAPLAAPAEWARRNDATTVALADIARYRDAAESALRRVGEARVPLPGAEDTTVVAFRPADGGNEYLAIVIGRPDPARPVLARVHSQCFTGDLLDSLRCDCGDQLRGAVRRIVEAGAGVILYLAQEGRGIGLINKLRAYTLQDRGYDTFDANETLGFDADERRYRAAAEMLRLLGYRRVRLMTGNAEKIAALRRFGIDVAERVPHGFPANPHNARYLAAKASRGAGPIRD